MSRLPVAALDLEGGTATLDGKVTKTSDRRVVELSANCVAWLRIWQAEFPDAEFMAPAGWEKLMQRLRVRAGLRPWPHDVLRHCAASYFHGVHGDKKRLPAMLGHSEAEDTLDRHYGAVRTKDGRALTKSLAGSFWELLPKG